MDWHSDRAFLVDTVVIVLAIGFVMGLTLVTAAVVR